ncbi:MAG: type III-A CRISPR-associated RAMP protein Csm3 [Desulfuromusa sp.]|nr:type III-A CRISPR-associated RAMP protein Csm3 [Desulfuromusa sp.]
MKLENIYKIEGKITILTGLHIGAGNDTMEIGGMDQPIIKHPLTDAPYIPGSSIKGKMRSLLETRYFIDRSVTRNDYLSKGKPCNCGETDCLACTIFGNMAKNSATGPTRIVVRDANLTSEFQNMFNSGKLPMEVKHENTIDRVKGTAMYPRPLERVPAGVQFDFNISLKQYEGDADNLKGYVLKGLKMIELDALGGNSSRGCGQVRFDNLKVDGESVELQDINL